MRHVGMKARRVSHDWRLAEASAEDCHSAAPLAAKKCARRAGAGALRPSELADRQAQIDLMKRQPPARKEIIGRSTVAGFAWCVDCASSFANVPGHSMVRSNDLLCGRPRCRLPRPDAAHDGEPDRTNSLLAVAACRSHYGASGPTTAPRAHVRDRDGDSECAPQPWAQRRLQKEGRSHAHMAESRTAFRSLEP